MSTLGWTHMSKREWYRAGGFSNNWLCRRGVRGGWSYWRHM
jgi:hypothetical protein